MKIYIPTYGRADRIKSSTFHKLPPALQRKTTLVVQDREKHLYAGYTILVLPVKIQTIAPTRQWIMDQHDVKETKTLVMLDDDLRFDVRRTDDPSKFTAGTPQTATAVIKALKSALRKYTHAGVLSREGGNRHHEDLTCSRMQRVLAYNVEKFRAAGVRFNRPLKQLPHEKFTMEDFDVTLQLLRAGHPNIVLVGWVQGQSSSNMSGGCESYRTIELQGLNAQTLARLHGPFVKVVEKTTKTAWGGATRLDVIVQWKRAYESSQR